MNRCALALTAAILSCLPASLVHAGAFGAQHSELNVPVLLNNSNTWTSLNSGITPLNTIGNTPNEIWDDGIYLISGTLSHPNSNSHVVTRLTVNGTPVTTSIQGNTTYGGNRLYHVGQLSAGDVLDFQYRTPQAGITIDPAADWQGGTINIFGGDNLANAQRMEFSGSTTLSSSNTWTPLTLSNTTLNTPGTTAGEIWADGLYIIKGSVAGPNSNSHLVTRLTVNGQPVEKSLQGNTTYGTNALSHVGLFSAGDVVQLQYRTPAALSLNSATDWNSASLSMVEVQAAQAQRSELAAPVTLNNSNTWQDLSLTGTTLNMPGTTMNEIWEDGIYLITGSLSGPQANSHVVTRLTINGVAVEESLQGNTTYGTNLMEHLAYLEAGDIVGFQYRTPAAGLTIHPSVDWQGASLSIVQFQEQVPEPTAIALWALLGLGLAAARRKVKRKSR